MFAGSPPAFLLGSWTLFLSRKGRVAHRLAGLFTLAPGRILYRVLTG